MRIITTPVAPSFATIPFAKVVLDWYGPAKTGSPLLSAEVRNTGSDVIRTADSLSRQAREIAESISALFAGKYGDEGLDWALETLAEDVATLVADAKHLRDIVSY